MRLGQLTRGRGGTEAMAQASILTAITFPGVTTIPSSKCLQWSGDGQAVLLARTSVHILVCGYMLHNWNMSLTSFISDATARCRY